MIGTMDLLPTEILQQVFDHLPNDDIVSLPARFVSRGLLKTSLSSRFGTVDVLLERNSLEKRTCFPGLFVSNCIVVEF